MTITFIVECDVCHHKYVLKCQCDHVMNHGSMPIRVGCKTVAIYFAASKYSEMVDNARYLGEMLRQGALLKSLLK